MIVPEIEVRVSDSAFLTNNLSATSKLERARTELLDLSARNRLLNIPRNSKTSRTIEIVDELSEETFRTLVTQNRALTFLPGRVAGLQSAGDPEDDGDEVNELAQPDDESVNERGVLNRHADTKLQTKLTSKGLQKRLLDLYFDARTLEEEQGVNILFLALGTLKWIDPANATNVRYAPLILIPVSLERGNASEQFKLRWRQEDPASNLSLEAFLDRVHTLRLPTFECGEDFSPTAYMEAVALAVSSKPDWSVNTNDIVLGFFSFAKFLMYRDLDPSAWPMEGGLTAQPLIRGLLSDGFAHGEPLIPDDAAIDCHIPPSDLLHIVDCDSSQSLAVHDVRAGRNLVIQGPPGTGKSQTIANVIASAIADGKTVLFVAEKMAALDVVKRRLDQAGVGDACLELHSNKANKRVLLDELRRTSELGSPKGEFATTLNTKLQAARDSLNGHATRMHVPHPHAGLTPYQVIGHLTRLRQEKFAPVDVQFEQPETWSADAREIRQRLVDELAQRIIDIGLPSKHPWNGVGLNTILPTEVERLVQRIVVLNQGATAIGEGQKELSLALNLPIPGSLAEFPRAVAMAGRVAGAPHLSGDSIGASVWDSHQHELSVLLEQGSQLEQLLLKLDGELQLAAWDVDVKHLRLVAATLPADFGPDGFDSVRNLNDLLPKLAVEVARLEKELGSEKPLDTVSAIGRAVATGERVAAAPNVSADVFAANVWDHGLEQAGDLAEAVMTFLQSKRMLQEKVVESAWSTDLGGTRQTLAIHGQSIFRFFRSDWRTANTLIKNLLKAPNSPLASQIEILDKLAVGQSSLSAIRTNDDFGRRAFGSDWRAERSDPAPLNALVEWMRSLRGLGAEPRVIASRLPDRPAIGGRTKRVQGLLNGLIPSLRKFWSDCGTTTGDIFPDALDVDHVPLAGLIQRIEVLANFQVLCASILTKVPARLDVTRDVLSTLSTAQRLVGEIKHANPIGENAFGGHWNGAHSDWKGKRSINPRLVG